MYSSLFFKISLILKFEIGYNDLLFIYFKKKLSFLQQIPDPLFNDDGIILPIKGINKLVKIPLPVCCEIDL